MNDGMDVYARLFLFRNAEIGTGFIISLVMGFLISRYTRVEMQ